MGNGSENFMYVRHIYIYLFYFYLVANYNFMHFERHFAWPISPFKMHKIIFVPENLKKIIFVPENLKKNSSIHLLI